MARFTEALRTAGWSASARSIRVAHALQCMPSKESSDVATCRASPSGWSARSGAVDHDHWSLRAAISWPAAVGGLLVALLAPQDATAGWVVLAVGIFVEIAGGWPFLRSAARLLRHGATSMDTLIAVGTLAALAVSAVEAIALGGRHVHLGGNGEFAARLHGVMAPLIVSILLTGRSI